ERHGDRAKPESVAVGQANRGFRLPAMHSSAVLALQVLDRDTIAVDDDPRVSARYAGRVEPDLRVGIAADHILTWRQRNLPERREQPMLDVWCWRGLRWRDVRHVPMKSVAMALDGP